MKEHEMPHVNTVNKVKHNDDHQIKNTNTLIMEFTHWVTSSDPSVKSNEATSLMWQDDDEYIVHYLSLPG